MDAFLGLGSNLGDRGDYLQKAINVLQMREDIQVLTTSPIYETAAVGYTEQPDFLNMVVHIETSLPAEALLKEVLSIEKQLGRIREIKWGPRTIDIDLLFYGKLVIRTEELVVPHPFLHERAFVLLPLQDIAPNWEHPELGVTVQEMAEQVSGKEGVHRWEKPLANGCVHIES